MDINSLLWTYSPYVLPYLVNPSQITNICVFLYKGYKWIQPTPEKLIVIHEKETELEDSETIVILSNLKT